MFSDVKRDYLFNFQLFGLQNFLNDRLVDEDFNLSDHFFLVSFYEVRTIDEDLLGNFFDDFFLDFEFYRLQLLDSIGLDDRFVSVFHQLDELNFWYFDFNSYF